jgi:hypothetical protein
VCAGRTNQRGFGLWRADPASVVLQAHISRAFAQESGHGEPEVVVLVRQVNTAPLMDPRT